MNTSALLIIGCIMVIMAIYAIKWAFSELEKETKNNQTQ